MVWKLKYIIIIINMNLFAISYIIIKTISIDHYISIFIVGVNSLKIRYTFEFWFRSIDIFKNIRYLLVSSSLDTVKISTNRPNRFSCGKNEFVPSQKTP